MTSEICEFYISFHGFVGFLNSNACGSKISIIYPLIGGGLVWGNENVFITKSATVDLRWGWQFVHLILLIYYFSLCQRLASFVKYDVNLKMKEEL